VLVAIGCQLSADNVPTDIQEGGLKEIVQSRDALTGASTRRKGEVEPSEMMEEGKESWGKGRLESGLPGIFILKLSPSDSWCTLGRRRGGAAYRDGKGDDERVVIGAEVMYKVSAHTLH
jgi:hypothetical protein